MTCPAFATSTARTVSNGDASNCDLLNPNANGNCGPWQTPTFGQPIPITQEDPRLLHGWNVRPWNWEFSTGVQHAVTVDGIRAMGAICMVTDDAGYSERAKTLVSLLLDGLRAGAPHTLRPHEGSD